MSLCAGSLQEFCSRISKNIVCKHSDIPTPALTCSNHVLIAHHKKLKHRGKTAHRRSLAKHGGPTPCRLEVCFLSLNCLASKRLCRCEHFCATIRRLRFHQCSPHSLHCYFQPSSLICIWGLQLFIALLMHHTKFDIQFLWSHCFQPLGAQWLESIQHPVFLLPSGAWLASCYGVLLLQIPNGDWSHPHNPVVGWLCSCC